MEIERRTSSYGERQIADQPSKETRNQKITPEEFKIRNDFLLKDYELKVRYLTDHFQRMWTRFNYFVTIELAITGGKFFIEEGKFSMELAYVGAGVSLIWYVLGAEDRRLVRIYEKHIEKAAKELTGTVWYGDQNKQNAYCNVHEIDETSNELDILDKNKFWELEWLSGWRIECISTTRLAALFPLLVFVIWMVIIIFRISLK